MPWQLTVRELRAALDGMPDNAVVVLHSPLQTGNLQVLGHNLHVKNITGMVVTLAEGMRPGPDVAALADRTTEELKQQLGLVVSRPQMAARLYDRLHGERKYWECFSQGILTAVELRNVLLGDALDPVGAGGSTWSRLDEATRQRLESAFDELVEAAAAAR